MQVISKNKNTDNKDIFWDYKSYGRIFVQNEEAVKAITKFIEKNSISCDFDYLPSNIFGINKKDEKWSDTNLVYNGKFDPDFNMIVDFCNKNNIAIEVICFPQKGICDDYYESLEEYYGFDKEFYWD